MIIISLYGHFGCNIFIFLDFFNITLSWYYKIGINEQNKN